MHIALRIEDIIAIASDLTAAAILMTLMITIISKKRGQASLSYLLSSAICIFVGVIQKLSALIVTKALAGASAAYGNTVMLPQTSYLMWTTAFVFTSVGICEAVAHIEWVHTAQPFKNRAKRLVVAGITIAAFAAVFMLTKDIMVYRIGILVQLIVPALFLYRYCGKNAAVEFLKASSAAILTILLAMVNRANLFTGLGYAVLIVVLYSQYLGHVERVLTETEEDLKLSELKLLVNQISPHYIYNSLQCIKGLTMSDPQKAGKAIDKFSGYLRGNLESLTKEGLIPFRSELEHTKAYLELEELSGSRDFEVEYDLGVTDFMLPPLVLQPVVENAVRHGSEGEDGKNHITIATFEREGSTIIEVTNTAEEAGRVTAAARADAAARLREADGRVTVERQERSLEQGSNRQSVGLKNVRTRLAMQCNGKLSMKTADGETKVSIEIAK